MDRVDAPACRLAESSSLPEGMRGARRRQELPRTRSLIRLGKATGDDADFIPPQAVVK